MFGPFKSGQARMRENAANWLELAQKVWNYRRDLLTQGERDELRERTLALRALMAGDADAAKLKLGIEALEPVLARTGGTHYPRTTTAEYVEFFMVAAIVILGIRAYFVQPFKIPTNSMWPSYYGMRGENIAPGGPAPGYVSTAVRFALYGAQRRTATAPVDGKVSAPLVIQGDRVLVAYTIRKGRSWLVFPTKVREYTLYVDGVPSTVTVPLDFNDFDRIFRETFFRDEAQMRAYLQGVLAARQAVATRVVMDEDKGSEYEALLVPLDREVRKGSPLVRFDITAGDQLFVDRVTYQFVRPSVGQGFVFRTGNIPGIAERYGDQYYIKRLAGTPGDRIEIRDPALLRNGAPITGAAAFDKNARKEGLYTGYANAVRGDSRFMQLYPGEEVTVPQGAYLALGDNSHDSFDGRYWGFVPARDVVGRPLFIYFPFTSRWGVAH
jgi:signal peptidase I